MARKTAGSTGDTWDKQGELHGFFTEHKSNVGRHQSNVYIIEKEDGTKVQVWGSTVLDTKFQEIPIGSEVWITCLGETQSKGGSTYVDYQVDYDDEVPAAEAAQAGGTPLKGSEAADATSTFGNK